MKNQYFRIADDSVNNGVLSLVTNVDKKKSSSRNTKCGSNKFV